MMKILLSDDSCFQIIKEKSCEVNKHSSTVYLISSIEAKKLKLRLHFTYTRCSVFFICSSLKSNNKIYPNISFIQRINKSSIMP